MIKILNVAEKNDAAKNVAKIMSKSTSRMRDGFSKFNKIYEYEGFVFNQRCQMIMTSVSGHLLSLDFKAEYQKWHSCSPSELFDAPVEKTAKNFTEIKRTLEREARGCSKLIIWTDCDREGENIGFEIIEVCKAVKPNIDVYRAIFSEITNQAVQRAINNLARPNALVNDAVNARIEIDLRVGAAFTRFQTKRIQKAFPEVSADRVVSYGTCQFPTLGFVVERFKQNGEFEAEPFWKIIVRHKNNHAEVEFTWERGRIFDYLICSALYALVIENPLANVIEVKTKPKSKWRPAALDTIELEKIASRKLKINAKETMKIAESLYTKGYISYPRTETNIFPKDFHLAQLVEHHVNDQNWGEFASRILQNGVNPRNGNKSDQAHPPIHPIKYSSDLAGKEKTVYDFIVRHFLACCSQDAKGMETTITIDINNEKFTTSGLMITERNYLEVYIYEKWSDKEIPVYEQGQTFTPTSIELKEGNTVAPPLLTEADLISLMEKHGIGTDATHAEHIETVKEREYVKVKPDNRFEPTQLGLGLVEGYDLMGYAMSKPTLRANLEEDLKNISEGRKSKDEVLREQLNAYKSAFADVSENVEKLDDALSKYFGEPVNLPQEAEVYEQIEPVFECTCKSQMVLRTKKDGKGFYIGCRSYPECKRAVWFPNGILEVTLTNDYCIRCQPKRVRKLKIKFERGAVVPTIPLDYITCILCDSELKDFFRISDPKQKTTQDNNNDNRPAAATITNTFNNNNRNNNYNNNNQTSQQHQQITPIANFQPRNPLNQANNTPDDGTNPIVCGCSKPASLLTVRKEGINQGRQFYSCSACSFFLWADSTSTNNNDDDDNNNQRNNSNNNNRSRPSNSRGGFKAGGASSSRANSDGIQCECGLPAILLTTNKPGVNQGRKFYKCNNNNTCKLFEWEDGNNTSSSGGGFSGSSGGARGGGAARGGARGGGRGKSSGFDGNETSTVKKRSCGICGESGHNRKNCPNLND